MLKVQLSITKLKHIFHCTGKLNQKRGWSALPTKRPLTDGRRGGALLSAPEWLSLKVALAIDALFNVSEGKLEGMYRLLNRT